MGDHLKFATPDEALLADDADEPFLREVADPEMVILPVPYERTTSYGSGTAAGPEALLRLRMI